MYGFFCVMLAAGFWDNFACHLHLPVSTTHTTVGATVGMALAIYGGDSVIWLSRKKEFPFIGGMVPIFLRCVSGWKEE
jgi:phosphate/sulfate permease